MNNFIPQRTTPSGSSPAAVESPSSAFAFISKGWREVRDSADADFQLMRDRANSFKNLASSFDRELENFINSASAFSVPAIKSSAPAEIEFVKKLQPKLSEFRRAYSSPDFSKKVLEKWGPPKPTIRIDLSAIRNAIVEEAEEVEGGERVRIGKGNKFRFKDFGWDWKADGETLEGEDGFKDWEPIRALKTRLKELEAKKSPDEIFGAWKNSEFVEKLKSSLV